MIPFLLIIAIVCFLLVMRLLRRFADVYLYVTVDNVRRKVLICRLTSDGTIIDITRPRLRRRVGQVYVNKDGKGIVRLYEDGSDYQEHREVGYVIPDGGIYTQTGKRISEISPEGERHWYELWLRRHAEVPQNDPDPIGECVESGRFKTARPNEVTLLARAGAALVLLSRERRGIGQTPRQAPYSFWDTALIAAFLFALVHAVPGVVTFFQNYYVLFPVLGSQLSYFVTMMSIFGCLWVACHVTKIAWLSVSNDPITYLTMVNRQTGIDRWGTVGAVLSGCAALVAIFIKYSYGPLFIGIFVGLAVSRFFATADGWYVTPRTRRYEEVEEESENDSDSAVRDYEWELDSPLRDATFFVTTTFNKDELERIRSQNPFFVDWKEAATKGRVEAKKILLDGEGGQQIKKIVRYILHRSRELQLLRFEEIQVVLDFVQEPNILYSLDESCAEIKNAKEYFRYPVETLFDKRGDCDCKALLAAALMRNLGYPILLLFSKDLQHAALAVGGAPDLSSVKGLFFMTYKGERFYFCETTGEGWKIGQETELASAMMSDPKSVIDLTADLPII